jgi:4-hydroxybenzoate polyprenyltransferase
VFARELFDPTPLFLTFKAFAAFCLTASAVYILNDIADLKADRVHPEKKNRPIASGRISVRQAMGLLILLLVCVAVLVAGMDKRFLAILITYFFINVAYSFKLKETVLLDVFIISAGFMLRVLGGAFAIDVAVSNWIVLCTLFISLFLGFAKRRAELVVHESLGMTSERKVLLLYSAHFIDQMLTVTTAGAVISYALYTVAPRTIEIFGTDKMIYTTVFVLYGLFRYLYLVHTAKTTENPTNAVTSDVTIMVTVLLWILTCIGLIYSKI